MQPSNTTTAEQRTITQPFTAQPSRSTAAERRTGLQLKTVPWQDWEDAPQLWHAEFEGTISRKPIMAFCSHPRNQESSCSKWSSLRRGRALIHSGIEVSQRSGLSSCLSLSSSTSAAVSFQTFPALPSYCSFCCCLSSLGFSFWNAHMQSSFNQAPIHFPSMTAGIKQVVIFNTLQFQ